MKELLKKLKDKNFQKKLFVILLTIFFLAGSFLPTLIYLF